MLRAVINFVRDFYRLMKTGDVTTGCRHDWKDDDSNPFRRQCNKCGRMSFYVTESRPRGRWT